MNWVFIASSRPILFQPTFQKAIHTFQTSTTLPIIVCTKMVRANRLMFDVGKQTHTAFLHLSNCGEGLQISHPSFRIPRMLYGWRHAQKPRYLCAVIALIRFCMSVCLLKCHVFAYSSCKTSALLTKDAFLLFKQKFYEFRTWFRCAYKQWHRSDQQDAWNSYSPTDETCMVHFSVLTQVSMNTKPAHPKPGYLFSWQSEKT